MKALLIPCVWADDPAVPFWTERDILRSGELRLRIAACWCENCEIARGV